MNFLCPRGGPASLCALGFSNPKPDTALGCSLLAVLQAPLLSRVLSERPPHTEAATLTEFVEQLRQRGVQLHAVSGAQGQEGGPSYHVYLTEDPTATWLAIAGQGQVGRVLPRMARHGLRGASHPRGDRGGGDGGLGRERLPDRPVPPLRGRAGPPTD
jgi:hypothetical protein